MTLVLPQPPSKPRPPATVLQGPADADAFRVKVGRYKERYYCDPLPTCPIAEATDEHWPSVSRIKSAKPFEGANYVAMKRIAAELSTHGYDGLNRVGYDRLYEDLKSIDKLGLQAAGKRGTHVHKMAEQMLYGLPVDEDGPGAAYLGALRDFFDAYQPELVAAEVVCINRHMAYGGTADAIIRMDGKTYLVDWKSRSPESDHAAYPEEAAQLAAYAKAEYVIVQGGDGAAKRAEFPAIDGALILSTRPDGVKIFPVDLHKSATYFGNLRMWSRAREDEHELVGKPWPTKRAQTVEAILDATEGGKKLTAQQARVLAGKAPGVVATSAPRKSAPDEGEPADPAAVEALQRAFAGLADNAKLAMKQVAAEALEAERPISVAQNPSVRRFEIARLLIAWVTYSGDTDDALLRDVLTMVLGTDAASQPGVPLGAAVSLLDPATARRCTEIFDRLAAGAALSFDEAGRPVLLAA